MPATYRDLSDSVAVCYRAKFPVEFVNGKCSREMCLWYGAFLTFAFHAKQVLATSTITYSFGYLNSPEIDFGGFNSAEKMPPSPSFLPALDISSPCRILVRNPSF